MTKSSPVNILALDLATKTGWALYENGRIESGVQDFSKQRGESNGMLFLKFNRWLENLFFPWDHSKPGLIVYEQPHHRGGAATEIAVNLAGRVQEFCARNRPIECTSVHSLTLKKFATGSGRAGKEEMIKAASCILGYYNTFPVLRRITDDNEADAICLLHYAIEKFGGSACQQGSVPSASQKLESTTAGG